MHSIFSGSGIALKFGWKSQCNYLRRFGACAMDAAGNGRVSNGGGGVVRFPLSASNALFIQKGDITKWSIDGSTDAIVNPANERMLGGGGADGGLQAHNLLKHAALFLKSGPEFAALLGKQGSLREYNVTMWIGSLDDLTVAYLGEFHTHSHCGFMLPASHVIHTVGPIYGANSNSAASLASAYRNTLRVAKENSIQYIAFPAISCGVYGYPYDEAATVAISTIKEFPNDFKEVHFVLFAPDIYDIWLNKADELLKD